MVWAQWWLFEGEGGFGSFDAKASCLNLGEEADWESGELQKNTERDQWIFEGDASVRLKRWSCGKLCRFLF